MCSLYLPLQYYLVNTVMSSERLLETSKTSSCAMRSVNALDVLDMENTDCSYVPLNLSVIEGGMGEWLILYFHGSKMVIC